MGRRRAWSPNVEFLNTDFLLDLTLKPRDVVFLSEVHNHFLMPFYGLCRLVHLANETLILDTGVRDIPGHSLELTSGWERDPARLLFHSFNFSDGLLLDFLTSSALLPSVSRGTKRLAAVTRCTTSTPGTSRSVGANSTIQITYEK